MLLCLKNYLHLEKTVIEEGKQREEMPQTDELARFFKWTG